MYSSKSLPPISQRVLELSIDFPLFNFRSKFVYHSSFASYFFVRMHFSGAHRDSESGEFGVCFLLESFFTSEEPSGLSLSQLRDASAPGFLHL